MKTKKFNLKKIKQSLKKPWSPVNIAFFDNYVLKAAIFKDEYHWHKHKKEDELFIVYEGSILMQTKKGNYDLQEGEGIIISKGLYHKPSAKRPAIVLMIEKKKLKKR